MLQFSCASHLISFVLGASPENFAALAMASLSQKPLCKQSGALIKRYFCKAFYRKSLSSCYGEVGKLQIIPNREHHRCVFYKYHLNVSGRRSSDFSPQSFDTVTALPAPLTEMERSQGDTRLNA